MNFFSSFTYGRLIKTFIPGFVLLTSFVFIIDGYIRLRYGGQSMMTHFALDRYSAEVVSSGVVLCVMFGLLSNTAVFAGLNDWLVRNPVKRRHEKLFETKKRMEEEISKPNVQNINDKIGYDNIDGTHLSEIIDAEYLIIHEFDTSRIMYIQEQYLYYMELHINLAFSLSIASASYIFRDIWVHGRVIFLRDITIALLCAVFSAFLTRIARQNYLKHNVKMLSLFASYFQTARNET